MKRFNTSIKKIVEAHRNYDITHHDKAIFLSNWDAELQTINIPNFDENNQLTDKCTIGSYYYWTDELNYKLYYQKYFQRMFNIPLDKNNFIIGNNGSSSIMLSLMALKELGLNKVLAFTPIYFSALNLFELLNYHIYRFDLDIENDFSIDVKYLEQIIIKNNIEILFITDPIFSSGIEILPKTYASIFDVCKKHDIWIVIDYIYGGMSWSNDNYIIDDKIAYIISNYSRHIIVESIAKRLFINGIKTATIFSESQIIKKIARLSICTVGSMCFMQLETLKNLYDFKNSNVLNTLIKENTTIASRRFNKILTLLQGKNCIISSCNCSYFFLLGIPYLKKMNDLDYAIDILNQTGVLTVPHSRYLLLNDKYYIFRINLLINESSLLEGIFRISNLI